MDRSKHASPTLTPASLALLACAPAAPPPPAASPPAPVTLVDSPLLVEPEPQEAPVVEVPAAGAGEFDVSGFVAPHSPSGERTPPVELVQLGARLVPRWKAKVGKTTFRTTMALVGDTLVIGTHGDTLNGQGEASDGVVLLAAATGQRRRLIRTPGTGDLDVGGVAVDGDRIYFSADNAQVVAADLEGKIHWRSTAKGKVRPAPALADLNGDGKVDVVVGDESGVLRALDGRTGAPLWTATTGPNEYGARGFIAAAAIADLDGDGRDDVVAGARDGVLAARRGRDGFVLWQVVHDSGMHASPVIADFDHDGRPEVLAAWSYGDVAIHDGASGNLRWGTVLQQDDGGIEGLFGTPTPLSGKPGVLVAPTAWWGEGQDGLLGVGPSRLAFRAVEGRVSSSAVVTDLGDDGTLEAIAGTEQGALVALRADGGYARLAQLGGGIEAPALLADVEGDGTFELLVASNDGLLTCFSTGSRARPAIPRFRGESAHNRGDLGRVSLGWSAAAARSRGPAQAAGGVRLDYLNCCSALQVAAASAPSPENRALLEAAARCLSLAAGAAPREAALGDITSAISGATLPDACR